MAGPMMPSVLGITGHSLVVLALAVIALVALVPTVNGYVTQQQRLAKVQQQVDSKTEQVAQLEAKVARWEDPTYVAAQARDRLLYAMPGETQYRLTDSSGEVLTEEGSTSAQQDSAENTSWYGGLWDSLVGANIAAPPEVGVAENNNEAPEDLPTLNPASDGNDQ